jgi:hypothetical protein
MNEMIWNRICEAAATLANLYETEVPARLMTASGNVWERDAQRREALNEFLMQNGLDPYSDQAPLEAIADELDGMALTTAETAAVEEEDEA